MALEKAQYRYRQLDIQRHRRVCLSIELAGTLFFAARDRFEKRLAILFDFHDETGKQLGELSEVESKELLGHLQGGWFETAIVSPHFFNSIMGFLIIAFAITYIN